MSSASLSTAVGRRTGGWLERSTQFAQRHREAWPAVGIVIATLAAYHFTLLSLFDFLRLETPLAYLPLLPIFCIGIAVITANRYAHAPKPIMDRQIDFLVGIPLVIVALLLITLAPVIASTYYWTDRADVVSMAMFAAGATIIAYGITWFWRLKAAFLFLLLMWPALYLHLMAGVMQSFSNWTNAMMAQVVHHLPLGASLGSNAGDVIINQANGSPLTISIGTACSGADTVLGFALVGGAVLTVLGGGKGRKLLWWVAGMVMAFALNIIRLTSIIALAHAGHPSFALGGYHAVIGLVLFAIAVLVMLWALPWFGLHLKEPIAPAAKSSVTPQAPIAPTSPDSVSGPVSGMTVFGAQQTSSTRAPRAWSRGRKIATGAVLVLTAFVALADHGLQPYAAFDDGSGAPTVKPFVATAAAPAGWQVYQIAQYYWAKQYFGDNSTWNRYSVVPPHSSGVAYADVVLTSDKSTLDTYNLLNCFLFHNYDIRTSERVDLGGGVYGLLLNYSDPATNTKWGTVSWAWPVTYKGDTYYERIALTSSPIQGAAAASAPSFQPQGGIQDIFLDLLNGVSGGHNDPGAAPLFHTVDNALQSEAQVLVHRAVQRGA